MSSSHQTSSEIRQLLAQAVEGLLWLSESESPLELHEWTIPADQVLAPDVILQCSGDSGDRPIQQISLESLFQPMMQMQDWQSQAEQDIVARFQSLYQLLQQWLEDVQVYRVGTVEVDVYIVGRISPTQVIGLHTCLVET